MKILVICTGNSCRSQMAEGFFRKFGGDNVEVTSAGLFPMGIHPDAIAVMEEIGIDISGQDSNQVNALVDLSFDYVITVCDNAAAHCPTFPGGGTRLHWPFDNPTSDSPDEDSAARFRRVRDEISRQVKRWLGEVGMDV